ncbi:MAG: hypothetical protein PVG39_11365 [Desulfobacteraceae bacterium]|jgi:hypothetical protein
MTEPIISNLGFNAPGSGSSNPELLQYDSMPSIYNPPQISASALAYRNDFAESNSFPGSPTWFIDQIQALSKKASDAIFKKEIEDTTPPAEQSTPNESTAKPANNLINQFSEGAGGIIAPLIVGAGVFYLWKYSRKRG